MAVLQREDLAQTHVGADDREPGVTCEELLLQRYRLAGGDYPDSLKALIPQFIEEVPHGVINGEPLRYCLKENGRRFLLYSVGWNGVDDGGASVLCGSGVQSLDALNGDWVWENDARE